MGHSTLESLCLQIGLWYLLWMTLLLNLILQEPGHFWSFLVTGNPALLDQS